MVSVSQAKSGGLVPKKPHPSKIEKIFLKFRNYSVFKVGRSGEKYELFN